MAEIEDCYECACDRCAVVTVQSQCRRGCATQDHESWGDCVRDARINVDRESLRVK